MSLQAKCVICDQIDQLDDDSSQAKRMRKHKDALYLCDDCYERIRLKTIQRHKTGKFKLYRDHLKKDPWFDS